jgi:hypothetical protein
VDEPLVAQVEQQGQEIMDLKEALIYTVSHLWWLYNACGFITREEALVQIGLFNETYGLVNLSIVDIAEFDDLTPEMFEDPEDG